MRIARVTLPKGVQSAIDDAQAQFAAVNGARAELRQAQFRAERNRLLGEEFNRSPGLVTVETMQGDSEGVDGDRQRGRQDARRSSPVAGGGAAAGRTEPAADTGRRGRRLGRGDRGCADTRGRHRRPTAASAHALVTPELLILAVGGLLAASVGDVARRRAAATPRRSSSSWPSAWRSARTAPAGSGSTTTALARELGLVALALILFDGGLNAGLRQDQGRARDVAPARGRGHDHRRGRDRRGRGRALPVLAARGLLLGSMLASTDSAAVFGLLRGSTLRRRLVHTMEAETAFNDPVVLVLVVGFIAVDPAAGLRRSRTWPSPALRELGHRRRARAVSSARVAAAALARIRLPMTGLYPGRVARRRRDRLRRSDGAAWLRPARRLPRRARPRRCGDSRAADDRRLPRRRSPGSARLRSSSRSGCSRRPRASATSPPRERRWRWSSSWSRGRSPRSRRRARASSRLRERFVLSWSELLGATPIVFASLAVAAGISGSRAALRHRLRRRRRLDACSRGSPSSRSRARSG